jgi:hypothetical protein
VSGAVPSFRLLPHMFLSSKDSATYIHLFLSLLSDSTMRSLSLSLSLSFSLSISLSLRRNKEELIIHPFFLFFPKFSFPFPLLHIPFPYYIPFHLMLFQPLVYHTLSLSLSLSLIILPLLPFIHPKCCKENLALRGGGDYSRMRLRFLVCMV